MTKTQSAKPKTPFVSAPLPWNWNFAVPAGVPSRDRCQSASSPKEREQAVELIAEVRRQEEISRVNDIAGMSDELAKLSRESQNAIGGVEGEMKRRAIRAADPGKYEAAQARLAQLRQEALDLVTPVLRRVLVDYSESLAEAAVAAEARLEANGLPIRDHSKVTINSPNADTWVLHDDAVCRALWSCRVKIEKTLLAIEPNNAVGACQFFLCSEEQEPSTHSRGPRNITNLCRLRWYFGVPPVEPANFSLRSDEW
jgi:hypothetical protein